MVDAVHQVTLAGRPVEVRAKEYQPLYELSTNAGRLLTHHELQRRLWGTKRPDDLGAIRTHLRRLRSKLGEDTANPTFFIAEPRVGYRMAKCEMDGEGHQRCEWPWRPNRRNDP